MENDLFSATETLHNAFEEVLKNEKKNYKKWGIRDQVKRLKESIEQRNLTVSEKLLLCYGQEEETLFPSREGNKLSRQKAFDKHRQAHEEAARVLDTFYALPEEEKEHIRKELGIKFIEEPVEKPSKNNTTTPFEHNKNKGQKNGKQ